MTYFIMSDIHIDFYVKKQSKDYNDVVVDFENFYKNYMKPADCLIFAGDCANDYYNQVNFYKFLSEKYQNIYVVFGNHDLCITSTFGNGNPVKYSEERMNEVKKFLKAYPNVHLLDGNVVDNIGGTMGMCDFHYETSFDLGTAYNIKQWQKHWFDSRTWHIKTSEWHSGYLINPIAIWVNERNKMEDIIMQQPKVMVTHFCPIELGIQREYEQSSSTTFFYFEGKKLLDLFEHEAWWFCGHIHAFGHCDYVNEKGNTIHIWAMPQAYPGENPYIEGAFECIYDSTLKKYGCCGKNYTKNDRLFNF